MSYSVARPGTALSTGSITGSLISSSSGDSAKFFIKCTSATFNATVPVVETTGSGDATVRYDHGDKPYYDITLQGVMLGDKAVQLENLTQQVVPATATEDAQFNVKLNFKFSGTGSDGGADDEHAFINMKVIVTQCQIQWDPKQPVVGVALQMKSMVGANTGLQEFNGDA